MPSRNLARTYLHPIEPMRFSGRVRWIAFTGLLWAIPLSARADAPADQAKRIEAKSRYEQAVEAYKKDRFKDAIDLFLEADRLAPSAPLSFNIARCYQKIGDDAGALHWYRDYLRRDPNAKNAADVQKLIHGLETSLASKGVQQISIMSTPSGATVAIDGRPVGVTPYTGEFAPGEHQLGLSLRGYSDNQQRFDLSADQAGDVVVRLVPGSEPAAAPVASSPAALPAPVASTPKSESGAPLEPSAATFGPWPWVSLAIGTAALGGSLAFELSRRAAEDDAKSELTQVGYKDKLDAVHGRQTAARVLVGAGGAFVAAGAVLLILNPRAAHDKERAMLGVWCAPHECGLGTRGRF